MADNKKKEFKVNPTGNNSNKPKFNISWIYLNISYFNRI